MMLAPKYLLWNWLKIAETNITSIQFALGISYPEYASAAVLSPGLGSQLKNIFEDEKITISVLSCYINLIHPDLEERENDFINLKHTFVTLQCLGQKSLQLKQAVYMKRFITLKIIIQKKPTKKFYFLLEDYVEKLKSMG